MPGDEEGVPSVEAAEVSEPAEASHVIPDGMELAPVGTNDKLGRVTSQIAPMQKAIEGIKGVGFESVDEAVQALSQYQSIRERQIPVDDLLQVWDETRTPNTTEQNVSDTKDSGTTADISDLLESKLSSFKDDLRKEMATEEHNRRVQSEWAKVEKSMSSIEDESQRQLLTEAAQNRFFSELGSSERAYGDGPLAGLSDPTGIASSLSEYVAEQSRLFSGAPAPKPHSASGPGGDNTTEQPPESSGSQPGSLDDRRHKAEAMLARLAARRNGE